MAKHLTHDQLRDYFEKDFNANSISRDEASNDLIFYWVTHWDDTILEGSQLTYKGEFDILNKSAKSIQADLDDNPIQVDFQPIDETRDDAAEAIDGVYRNTLNDNTSIEAFEVAQTEAIVCGVGAWLIHSKYESNRPGNKKQKICRKPIYEANNTVFWDSNAKYLDKSDAKRCSLLTAYSETGYKTLVEDLTGKKYKDDELLDASTFANPNESYTFPWITADKKIYVVSFYNIEQEKDKILTFRDPFGEQVEYYEQDVLQTMDELMDSGYELIEEEEVKRDVCYKYTASGEDILKIERIAGEFIPVIVEYGEHAVVEGEEIWRGMTRLAKDPQRLRDFSLSYLADIMSRSPREKPIYYPEQIKGFENMYAETGVDDNYPYRFQNRFDKNGNELPIGAVGMIANANIPPALPMMVEETRNAVADVANPGGVVQDVSDPDLSNKALVTLMARIERMSLVYQQHRKHALRRDGQVFNSMAKEVYDIPRKVSIELPDGTRKQVHLMEQVIDRQTGDLVTLRDLSNSEFEVYSKISTTYASQKEQTIDRLEKMIALLDPMDPTRKILQLTELKLVDGVDFEDIREYVNKQLLMMGVRKPETPEEEQMLQAAEQNKQPDAATLLAMAENKKGDAALLEQKRKGIEMQLDNAIEQMGNQVKAFDSATKRMEVMIAAQEVGANIRNKDIDTFGKKLDNTAKIIDIKNISTDNLYKRLGIGGQKAANG